MSSRDSRTPRTCSRSVASPGRITALSLSLLTVSILLPAGSCKRQERPHNLVIVLSDALRASNLPFHGYSRNTAPSLQALLPESVLFERHLANFPGTPVSVSQMMTGRLMAPLLMNPAPVTSPVKALEPNLLILPEALQEAGFETAIVSSHVWFDRARILDAFDRKFLVPPEPGEPYAPFERLIPPARDVIGSAEEPFFLYVHSMDTHGPFRFHAGFDHYRGMPGWPEVYNAYDSEILYTDAGVERILDALRHRGVLERTIFVFTSDHGEELGEMGPEYWNRSHGFTVRRVQLHVPLLIRLPGGRLGGTVRTIATQHLDLAPTLLRLAAPRASLGGYRFDGRDLGPGLNGKSSEAAREFEGVIAVTWRYWSIHAGDLEVHWDAWNEKHDVFQTTPTRFNYPMSVSISTTDASRRPGLLESLRARLDQARRHGNREWLRMATLREQPESVVVGVPGAVLDGTASSPTYERNLDDDLWMNDPWRRLEAGPEETPEAVTLGMPWIPGRYQIRIRLAQDRRREGWENRFRVRFPLSSDDGVHVDGARATAEGFVDLGTHQVGRYFAVEFAEPQGGVAIKGFSFESERAASGAESPLDPELEERLRALGYVD